MGWAIYAAALGVIGMATGAAPIGLHALWKVVGFAMVAWQYFRQRGARDPLPTALSFAAVAAALDLAFVAGFVQRDLALLGSITGFWLPLLLIVLVTWAIGAVRSTLHVSGLARTTP
jgi:hypothetical protein